MRVCKIVGCKTNSSDKDRSIFEIKGQERQTWIPIIQMHQTLNLNETIYICDLHFNGNDLYRHGDSLRPKKDVAPQFRSNVVTAQMRSGPTVVNEDVLLANNANSDDDMVSISRQTFRRLCNESIELIKAKKGIEKLNKSIAKLNDQIEKQKGKYSHLSVEETAVLDAFTSRSSGSRRKYPPELRQFCLRIRFHSNAAYKDLRKFFRNRLPTVRTLQRWLRCVDCSPGITQVALDAIKEKAESYKKEGKELLLCLISDEMGVRKHVQWNTEKCSFDGFSTNASISSKERTNENSIAKDALVFMAVGPNFKIPVAYFMLSGLDGTDRAVLTREVIRSIDQTSARVISLTSDALYANISVFTALGADFKNGKSFFPRPSNGRERIYAIFDPPHMLKLVRQYFSESYLHHENDHLNWEFIKLLAERQGTENFDIGHKLTHNNINWHLKPMSVKYAAQTMSCSVADALEQLSNDGYNEFDGCEKTVKFIRLQDSVFDVMNYGATKKTNKRFKRPLCAETIDSVEELFEEVKEFYEQMKGFVAKRKKKNVPEPAEKEYREVRVFPSKSFMGFFGFYHNMSSTLGLYQDLVKNGSLDRFHTFQYSQDHLETFFSLMRSGQGNNKNPTSQQFEAAYRSLLICSPHLSAEGTNCIINSTEILTVSSGKKPSVSSSSNIIPKALDIESDFDAIIHSRFEPYILHMFALAATNIERNIERNIKARSVSGCQDCKLVFAENDKTHDDLIAKRMKNTDKLFQPCTSTINIIKVAEVIFKHIESNNVMNFQSLALTVFSQLDIESLYESSEFDRHQIKSGKHLGMTHKEEFIHSVVLELMHVKSRKIGSKITDEEREESMVNRRKNKEKMLAGH